MERLPTDRSSRSDRCSGRGEDFLTGRKVVIWRHGRTAWNAERRFQGHSDVPLDEVGVAQAKAAAILLAQMKPTAIVSSDLGRTRATADELVALTGLPVVIDPQLRETYAGEWEGLNRTQLEASFGPELAAWAAGSNLKPGGGERRSEVCDRMLAAIDRALKPVPAGGTLVVVSHGGSARAAIGGMLGLPTDHWGILGVLNNCAWCVLGEVVGAEPKTLADISVSASAQFPDVPRQPTWRLLEYNARTLPEEPTADDR